MQFATSGASGMEKSMPTDFHARKLCDTMQMDNEYWQEISMDPECSGNVACSVPITDKRARHKLVERNRRERTRELVQQLQSVLPNIIKNSQNPNTNDILEKTLEYLQMNQIPENRSCDSCMLDDDGENENDCDNHDDDGENDDGFANDEDADNDDDCETDDDDSDIDE